MAYDDDAAAIKQAVMFPKNEKLFLTMKLLGWLGFVLILGWAWSGAEMRPMELVLNFGNILDYFSKYFPPDLGDFLYYIEEMIVTIQIAVWGTFAAVIFSIPFGLLSAHNVTPVWLRHPVRRLMDMLRAVNEIVFALIFVAAIGLGPFAGVLALFVHTLGTLAKLFSEAVEAIDPKPIEGIRATGAGKISEIIYGIIPQVTPLWISYSLYRFEANVRSATVLGIVGAGGIGQILHDSMNSFYLKKVCSMLIIIIVTVSVIDLVSSRIRKYFI
ncbi:MAG: phosphonate ABC transporter, permease protein PhnE [Spirochaetales bacterium]|nr:phosphonate ABC transporter, permease protein PhnE [Spirochaetales bacterium]